MRSVNLVAHQWTDHCEVHLADQEMPSVNLMAHQWTDHCEVKQAMRQEFCTSQLNTQSLKPFGSPIQNGHDAVVFYQPRYELCMLH